jgi:selenide,water dikinase
MNLKITELSTGGGCGCKIPEADLRGLLRVLSIENQAWSHEDVGRFGGEVQFLGSIDFLQPIIDEEEQFGRIAALHAFSDMYAKGCQPEGALVIMCWPRELIGMEGAARVLAGCQKACNEAGVRIIGGHSIDAQNPIFGLSVFGREPSCGMAKVDSAARGDNILITKPLGIGITSNAIKRKIVSPEGRQVFDAVINKSNAIGIQIAKSQLASSMTDITGFGLLGQLHRMAQKAALKFEIDFGNLPRLPNTNTYFDHGLQTKLGAENANSFRHFATDMSNEDFQLICDPQTNGGLLFTSPDETLNDIWELFSSQGESCWRIGRFT